MNELLQTIMQMLDAEISSKKLRNLSTTGLLKKSKPIRLKHHLLKSLTRERQLMHCPNKG